MWFGSSTWKSRYPKKGVGHDPIGIAQRVTSQSVSRHCIADLDSVYILYEFTVWVLGPLKLMVKLAAVLRLAVLVLQPNAPNPDVSV